MSSLLYIHHEPGSFPVLTFEDDRLKEEVWFRLCHLWVLYTTTDKLFKLLLRERKHAGQFGLNHQLIFTCRILSVIDIIEYYFPNVFTIVINISIPGFESYCVPNPKFTPSQAILDSLNVSRIIISERDRKSWEESGYQFVFNE